MNPLRLISLEETEMPRVIKIVQSKSMVEVIQLNNISLGIKQNEEKLRI